MALHSGWPKFRVIAQNSWFLLGPIKNGPCINHSTCITQAECAILRPHLYFTLIGYALTPFTLSDHILSDPHCICLFPLYRSPSLTLGLYSIYPQTVLSISPPRSSLSSSCCPSQTLCQSSIRPSSSPLFLSDQEQGSVSSMHKSRTFLLVTGVTRHKNINL